LYDTTNREIKIDPHHGLVEINTKARLLNIDDVFVSPSNANKFITHTLLPLEMIVQDLTPQC
jgi:hypothetical protein